MTKNVFGLMNRLKVGIENKNINIFKLLFSKGEKNDT